MDLISNIFVVGKCEWEKKDSESLFVWSSNVL